MLLAGMAGGGIVLLAVLAFWVGVLLSAYWEPKQKREKQTGKIGGQAALPPADQELERALQRAKREYENFLRYDGTEQEEPR